MDDITKIAENESAIVINLKGDAGLNQFLLVHGISIGTVFIKNYSPGFAQLINITVGGKMISLRKSDFDTLEWQRI